MIFPGNKILSVGVTLVLLSLVSTIFLLKRQAGNINKIVDITSSSSSLLFHSQKLLSACQQYSDIIINGAFNDGENDVEILKKLKKTIINEVSVMQISTGVMKQGKRNDTLANYIHVLFEYGEILDNTTRTKTKNEFHIVETNATISRIIQLTNQIQQDQLSYQENLKKKNSRSISRLNRVLYILLAAILISALLIIRKVRKDIKQQKDTEQKFSSLLDAAPDATVIVDEDGVIKMINQQMINLFGYSRKDIIGKPVENLIPENLRKQHVHHRTDFAKQPKIRPMGAGIELNAIKKNGIAFPVEISLSPIQTEEGMLISASIRDITIRKKAEEKFRSLLDSAPDATVIVDEKGIIQMINNQTENLFGYARNEIIGKPVEVLIPAELRERHIQHRGNFTKSARIRAMGEGIELNAVTKNGKSFPVEISLSPIQTEEGMLVSASVRDISSRKKLEDELKKSNSELEAFTYSVSHDLRAPLRGIIGFTAILEEDYAGKLDDEAKRITSVIRENTLKMGHLIDDLLAFSRTGKLEMIRTQINMKTMVNEIIQELVPDKNEQSKITWHVHPLPPVNADLSTIRQVWVNLISNAIKYSGKKDYPVIEIGSYFDNGKVVFYIKDNGVGFDEQYKHKLFKVFQRLHDPEEFEGTGVGLALVEKIVSKHGGNVWAEGFEDEGASFYFSLPV